MKITTPSIPGWLLLLLALTSAAGARAQQVAAPVLQEAAAYGLLSGANLVAGTKSDPLPIRVQGRAGATGTVGAGVQASAGVYDQGSGTVLTALADVKKARDYCTNLGSSSLDGKLDGQTLAAGAYEVTGDAGLGPGATLTLSGDTATVIVLNVTGSLELGAQARVVLDGVLPQHVFWNVTGNLAVASDVSFSGVALTGGSIRLTGIHAGCCALLSQQGIVLAGLSAMIGHNEFYARSAPDPTPQGVGACDFVANSGELVLDGSFEYANHLPDTFNGLCYPSAACYWYSATEGTADYYHAGSGPDVGVPVNVPGVLVRTPPGQNVTFSINAPGQNSVYDPGQNTTVPAGDAYAGVYASSNGNAYFEYVAQQNPHVLRAGHRYYAEFSARLAPSSTARVETLGMALAPLNAFEPANAGSFGSGPLTTPLITPLMQGPVAATGAAQHLNWHRIGQVITMNSTWNSFTLLVGNFTPTQTPGGGPSSSNTPNPSSSFGPGAYYYLDNVTLSMVTEAGADVTLGPTCLGGTGGTSTTLGTLPMPTMVGATYRWTVNGIQVFTDANYTVSPSQTTTYTLTVSIPVPLPTLPAGQSTQQTQIQTYTSTVTVNVVGYNYGQLAGATYTNPVGGGAAYEIGAAGTTTTLNGNGGTVIFKGRYHVLGDVKFTNGTFRLQPGTVFFIDSNYGPNLPPPGNSPPTRLTLNGANLQLFGATLQATACTDRTWDGVYLTNGSTIRTSPYNNPSDDADPNNRRSLVRDMGSGINSSAGNHYYLSGTDFVHNQVSLREYPQDKVALAGEGVTGCTFRDGDYGILLEEEDYYANHTFGGDYDQAQFANNVFEDLRSYGLYATAGKAHVEHNTFRRCGIAAIATWSAPQAGRAAFTANTIEVPLGPFNTLYYAGPVGIAATDGASLVTDNVITSVAGAPTPSTAAPAPRVGILGTLESGAYPPYGSTSQQFGGNTVTGLDFGIAANLASQYPYSQGLSTLAGNTLKNNAVGIALGPGFLYPYTSPPGVAIIAQVRCNSFINDASSPVTNPIGLWIRPNTVINGGLAEQESSGAYIPNGNKFDFQTGSGRAIVNDGNQFTYQPSNSLLEAGALSGGIYNFNNNGPSTATVRPGVAISGRCAGQPAGVQRLVAPANFAALLDSLHLSGLASITRTRLQQAALTVAATPAELTQLEAVLAEAIPDQARALGLGLLAAYRLRHDIPAADRLRTYLRTTVAGPNPELSAYLTLTEALDQMPSFLPGLRPLSATARLLLRQAATSGTTSAEQACRLLRAYEPTCSCRLPVAPAASRPASTPLLATRPLGVYPNPANTTLHVPLPTGIGTAELRAYDATGRLVLQQAIGSSASEVTVAVRGWATGLYQFVLTAQGRVLGTQRVAVQP